MVEFKNPRLLSQGFALGSCLGFPLPGGSVPRFRVQHRGGDAWTCAWVRILLDDQTWAGCPGFNVDDDEVFEAQCEGPALL